MVVLRPLDSGFHRSDDLLREYQICHSRQAGIQEPPKVLDERLFEKQDFIGRVNEGAKECELLHGQFSCVCFDDLSVGYDSDRSAKEFVLQPPATAATYDSTRRVLAVMVGAASFSLVQLQRRAPDHHWAKHQGDPSPSEGRYQPSTNRYP